MLKRHSVYLVYSVVKQSPLGQGQGRAETRISQILTDRKLTAETPSPLSNSNETRQRFGVRHSVPLLGGWGWSKIIESGAKHSTP